MNNTVARRLLLPMLLLAMSACQSGTSGAPSGVTPPPAAMTVPTIASFTASPGSITPGQSATLSWQVTGATQITIDNGVGAVQASGSAAVTPGQTVTYQLTATNGNGTASRQATVTVTGNTVMGLADPNATFSASYRGSTIDAASGQALGGTEFRNLVAHKGQLFGGLEAFNDNPPAGQPVQTARIVMKPSASAPWRIDRSFEEPLPAGSSPPAGRPRIRHEGVTALASISFNNDGNGRPLATPQTILVAGLRDFLKGVSFYVRNDSNGTWSEQPIETLATTSSSVRAFGSHRDKVTGADMIFVGANPGGIYSGTINAAGVLTMRTPAELSVIPATRADAIRPTAFVECGGDIFTTIAPYVYRRIDGTNPRWEVIYDYSAQFTPGAGDSGSSGLRGLTCVDKPGGGLSLITGFEGPGVVLRFDRNSSGNFVLATQSEYNANTALSAAVGKSVSYSVLANNLFTPLINPDTGQTAHIMTLQTRPNASDDAYYAIRSIDGTYTLSKISSAALGFPLNSTRTAVVSPFPEENGSVVYLGGFDVVDTPNRNSAYVARAGIRTVLGLPTSLTQNCPVPGPLGGTAGLQSTDIAPQLAIGPTQFNANNVVMSNLSTPFSGKLVVFLPGSNGAPGGYRSVLAAATRLGHRAIGLSYVNNFTIDQLCAGNSDINCDLKARTEIITGQDTSTLVSVDRTNSIENRLIALLSYLIVQQPDRGWDSFLQSGQLQWDRITISGHSQGGGHAALIAKLNRVRRVAMFAAPADFNETLGQASPWLSQPSLTPNSAFVGFDHRLDPLVRFTATWSALGMPTYGPQVVIDRAASPYQCSRQLVTDLALPSGTTGTQIHNAVAVDGATPMTNGSPDYLPVWAYMFGP
ncbi:MAG: PKD domain-containing protein [Sphingomonas sp.]|nr:PKD domain-containing protein [Sphingomonas sp.]